MTDLKRNVILRIIETLDVMLVTLPFIVCWYRSYAFDTVSPFFRRGNWIIILLFLTLYILFGRIYDGFQISLNQISEIIYSQGLAVFIADFIMYVVTCLLMKHLPNPLPLIAAFLYQVLLALCWVLLAHKWYFTSFPPEPSAIIYDRRQGMEQLIREYGLGKRFDIRTVAGAEECLQDLHVLDGVKAVFLSGVCSHDRNIILKYCVDQGINAYVIPRVGDGLMSSAKRVHMFHLPVLMVKRYEPDVIYLFIKRLLDIVLSLAAIVVTSPILLVTAIVIKRTDGGPVFYKQCRLTKDGRKFDVLKFRSMRVDAEKDGVARLSTGAADDRITPVGKFIRKVRIDELPQLFCILDGSMSIVGPRPERPEIAAQYEEEMPEFRLRLQAKAGLTGLAQVYGKYNTTPYDKLQMDLMYISKPSIVEDLRIMFATVKILFMPESTEGVKEGQETAMGEETYKVDV